MSDFCDLRAFLWSLLIAAVFSATPGCGESKAVPSPLASTNWEVTACRNSDGQVVPILEGTHLTVQFGATDRVSGTAGCNDYFAIYTVSGETISIGKAGATRKFCADPAGVMDQETMFLDALTASESFRISGDRLELLEGGDAVAVTLTRASFP